MKRSLALLLVLSSAAYADERSTTVTIGGMAGGFDRRYQEADYVHASSEALVGPRLTLSWETAPLAMPDQRGYRFAGAIVPELVAGAFIDDTHAAMFIGAGLRAELRISQREMGLLRVSARGAFYVAARGLVVGEERKPFGEFTLGEYFLVGRATRLGIEAGVIAGRAEMTEYARSDSIGAIIQAYIGWQP